jgi:hypothetical protein
MLKQHSPVWDQELNLDSLRAYLKLFFPDRQQADGPALSAMVEELGQAGHKSIEDVKAMVEKKMKWFLEFEKKHYPISSANEEMTGRRFAAVGVVRIILNDGPKKMQSTSSTKRKRTRRTSAKSDANPSEKVVE